MSDMVADQVDEEQPEEVYEPAGASINLDEDDCPIQSPPWMATFADLGTLLMAFFVLILAQSVIDSPRAEEVAGSLALAFGVERIVPDLEIPMGETLLETQYTPSEAENTILDDATQSSDDTTQDYIKQMTERGDAVSTIQGQYVQVLEELENEIETGQVNVNIDGEKIVVEMTEGDQGSKGKSGRGLGGVSQETIEVANKIYDLARFGVTDVTMKREPGWEAKGREVTTLSSVEEIKSALSEEIADGIAEVEKQGDSVLIRLTKADSFVSGEATLSKNFESTLLRVGTALEDTIGIIRVEGHTDNQMVGFSDRYKSNFDLSAARAAAVADYLMASTQLQTGRMTITGLADTKPMADNATAEGRAKNRRIELYLDE
jgi:chemotaxis protein MotB